MRRTLTTVAAVLTFYSSAAFSAESYVDFDKYGNIVISGPFRAVIPKPEGAKTGGPVTSYPNLLDEQLKVSTAGYFADDRFVTVQIETTNAPAGTLTNTYYPIVEIAGEEFRARDACVDISQQQLDANSDPMFEFIEAQNVQIVPAMQAVQLVVVNDDGTAEGCREKP